MLLNLVEILRKAVPTLDEFYAQEEASGSRIDMATSAKVVL